MVLANSTAPELPSPLVDTLMSVKAIVNWLPPLPFNPSQLPSMPTQSNSIPVVSSMTGLAVPNWTTVFWLLVMKVDTGLLRTHGVDHGVKTDTSDSLEEAPVL